MPEEANNVRPHSVDSYRKELKIRWERREESGEEVVMSKLYGSYYLDLWPPP